MENTLYKLKKALVWILSRISALLLTIMSILIIYQVFTRYVLNNPADFTEEIIRYMLIWTGFIGAAYAFLTREHMALTLLADRVSPEKRRKMLVTIDILILLIALFVIVIGGFKLVYSARIQRSALLGIPRSLVYVVAPISGIFIVIAQIINIWESFTGNTIKIDLAEETMPGSIDNDYSLNPEMDKNESKVAETTRRVSRRRTSDEVDTVEVYESDLAKGE